MRLALFSPLNPIRSGISDYTEELLPALGELADVDLFVDGFVPTNRLLRERFEIYDCSDFPSLKARRSYAASVYQMGNSIHHDWICRALMRYPGIVVLHEVVLHHFFLEVARRTADWSFYLRELAYSEGSGGIKLGLDVLRDRSPAPLFDSPLLGRIADASLGVIVHSKYARDSIISRSRVPIAAIPAPVNVVPPLSPADRPRVRTELGFPPNSVLFGAFGKATPAKRLDLVLRVFSRFRFEQPSARMVIVGEVSPNGWLDAILANLQLGDSVRLTGAVPFQNLQRYIQAADVCVNLRYPTAGETSAILLRGMAAGLPCIVSDVGAFSELPDDCCYKIPVAHDEDERLLAVFRILGEDAEERQRVGARGRAFVRQHHAPSMAAAHYVSFVADLRRQVLTSLSGYPRCPG